MFVLSPLFVPAGIEHNNHEDEETQPNEDNHPGPVFPDLLNAIRKLGPIHAAARYTASAKK
jgi:hypothetical protein